MHTSWWRRLLQHRLGALAVAALLVWVGITALAASLATGRIAETVLAERRAHARDIAARVEAVLEYAGRQLDAVARTATDDTTLVPAMRRVPLADAILRIGADGEVLWTRHLPDGRLTAPLVTSLPRPASGGWQPDATGLIQTPRGNRVFLVMPVRESDPLGGALAAAVDPRSASVRALLASYAKEGYRVEIEDDRGQTIASSRPRADDEQNGSAELVAGAPVSGAHWSVQLMQPRREALAAVFGLRRVFVGSSIVLLPFAGLAMVIAARRLRRPVLEMTAAAEHLAHGELATPIPATDDHEIGRLSAALEQLRRALTGDEQRSLLLTHVIAAQEDERRRIAQVFDDLGLLPAIRAYAQAHLASARTTVRCVFAEPPPILSSDATIALYRVAQEAITNAARHARASTVEIRCTTSASEVALEIVDDGVGFQSGELPASAAIGSGSGLRGMRDRLAQLGGRLDVDSAAGRGTRVIAVVPSGVGGEQPKSQITNPKSQIPRAGMAA